VITLESILEELVGEIQDEFDSEEEQIVVLDAGRRFRISGLTPIHDIEEALEIEVDNEEVSTFGGLITGELGHIPESGERLNCYGMGITVDDVDGRRVITATVELAQI
jgi:magnesium and cobalt transporter